VRNRVGGRAREVCGGGGVCVRGACVVCARAGCVCGVRVRVNVVECVCQCGVRLRCVRGRGVWCVVLRAGACKKCVRTWYVNVCVLCVRACECACADGSVRIVFVLAVCARAREWCVRLCGVRLCGVYVCVCSGVRVCVRECACVVCE
jgi:hypothetical protein